MGNALGVRFRADFRANRSIGSHSREAAREPGLRCSSADHGYQEQHQRQHQKNMNESIHHVVGDQGQNPQHQQYDYRGFQQEVPPGAAEPKVKIT